MDLEVNLLLCQNLALKVLNYQADLLLVSGMIFEQTTLAHSVIQQILFVCQIYTRYFATCIAKSSEHKILESLEVYILGREAESKLAKDMLHDVVLYSSLYTIIWMILKKFF